MKYSVRQTSRRGTSHTLNEDCMACSDTYIIVADGMGGEGNGDLASKIAVRTICAILDGNGTIPHDEYYIKNLTINAIYKANHEIGTYVDEHPETAGMGTTAIIMIWRNDTAYIAWCGDCRCYVYNQALGLRSLTKDHSYVQELVDAGKITVDETFTHPDSNLVSRYIGESNDVCHPDFAKYTMTHGDVMIVCSDGLSGYCRDHEISQVIDQCGPARSLPDKLANLAISCGSADDITIVTLSQETPTLIDKLKNMISGQ